MSTQSNIFCVCLCVVVCSWLCLWMCLLFDKKKNVNNKNKSYEIHHFLQKFSSMFKHRVMKIFNQIWGSLVMRLNKNSTTNKAVISIRIQITYVFFSLSLCVRSIMAIKYQMKCGSDCKYDSLSPFLPSPDIIRFIAFV